MTARVVIVELPHRFGAVAAQLQTLEASLAQTRPGDIVVLPELALTGYVAPNGEFDVSRFAESADGMTAQKFSTLARTHQVTLCAPLVERSGLNLFNTLLTFDARGALLAHYRKRHPWYPETWATPGNLGHPVVQIGDLRITFAVCFDVHFLSEEAGASLDAADVLIFPSAWVEDEEETRAQLLIAIAQRHQVSIVNANWGQGAPYFSTQGRSLIIAASGSIVAETSRAIGGAQLCFTDLKRLP